LKSVLITGATGGLGRNAVEYLLTRGVMVRATGRNVAIGAQLQAAGAEFVAHDLAKITTEQRKALVEGVDTVWHCAALSSPWGKTADFIAANLVATRDLVSAAATAGVAHFVHISTPALYFDYTHHRDIPESYQPLNYVNQYAQTKAWAERVVLASAAACPSMRHVILRPRAIFGPYDQVLLPRIERLLAARDGVLPLPRNGATVLDLTYAENVVHAMDLAVTVPDVPSGSIFNVTNDEPYEIGAVLHSLFSGHLRQSFAVRNVPYLLLDGAARVLETVSCLTGREPALTRYSIGALAYDMTLDISHIQNVLGYVPPVSMEEGIRRTADWMRARSHG
jgi:nucleoside-diphosphate-sugar epimerase